MGTPTDQEYAELSGADREDGDIHGDPDRRERARVIAGQELALGVAGPGSGPSSCHHGDIILISSCIETQCESR
jgi:hypothetical protein